MLGVGHASSESNGGDGLIANLVMNPQVIDRELRRIAKEEARLLHEKTHLLVSAVRLRVWAAFGRGSLLEYLEEIFGYTPKVARDHVRVAFAIEEMPALGEMLESREQSYTALRELSRVATAETIDEWRAAARGMNVRQIEQLVAAHAKGDLPTDPRNPDLAIKKVTLELRPSTNAKLRQVRQVFAAEHDGFLDDDAFIEALCTTVLDGGEADQGRARHQIMTTICDECGKGWQDAAGRVIAIDPIDVERAECDAQRIGSSDHAERATQDIAPKVRRHVWRRDHGKCCVPSCRASRNIDIHHIVHRADGGGHDEENLLLLCGGHHRALHEGKLEIRGTASRLIFNYGAAPMPAVSPTPHVGQPTSALREARIQPRVAIAAPHVGPTHSNFSTVVMVTEAKQALEQLGFKKLDAARYVDEALTATPDVPSLPELIRGALQRSRRTGN